jgi:alkanesulfonate monooxygenase SsuD/methylene tetrahydromethanopterin reductase-like flavin-dependent oxidoreductase (luciferase family)
MEPVVTRRAAPSFGIKTTPADVGYDEIRRVWLEADGIPEIEHAWLYDHLLPNHRGRVGDPSGPVYEGWTLLTALAAQTQRLRFGLVVTNNRIRLPAVLAKIAATVDVISDGRLDFGIGVGGLPDATLVAPEYEAYGVPIAPWSDAVASFVEACTLIRRMWTEEVFDFDGSYYQLKGARCSPKPVQRPHPPILIGGSGTATLRIVAEHADIWNVIGPPTNTAERLRERSAVLDEQCEMIGRDPGLIVRSVQLPVSYEDPASTREMLLPLVGAHFVLNLPAPYPNEVARWVADELVTPTVDHVGRGRSSPEAANRVIRPPAPSSGAR